MLNGTIDTKQRISEKCVLAIKCKFLNQLSLISYCKINVHHVKNKSMNFGLFFDIDYSKEGIQYHAH